MKHRRNIFSVQAIEKMHAINENVCTKPTLLLNWFRGELKHGRWKINP